MKTIFSGKFVLRVPPDLHAELSRSARERGVSLNQACLDRLQAGVAKGGLELPFLMNDTESRAVRDVHARCGSALKGLFLFGSAARGDLTADSDIDLLWVLAPSTPIDRQLYRQADAGADCPRVSHHFVHLPAQESVATSLWLEVALDGVALWDPGLEVSRCLGRIRREIVEGKFERKFSHGHSYWVKSASGRPGSSAGSH